MPPLPGVRVRPPGLARAALPLLALLLAACASAAPPVAAPVALLEARANAAPADADAALRLAHAYRDADRLEDARVLLERASANLPREPRLVLLLGLTYEELGRFADARRLYQRYADAPGARLRREVRGRLPLLARAELRAAAREALAREAELGAAPPAAATLAVFPFRVEAADSTLRPLGRALAEMLSTDLAQTPRLTVLERARVQALLDEARIAELTDPASAVRAGRLLAAGSVVQGRVSGGEPLRLEALVAAAGGAGSGPTLAREAPLERLLEEEKELALRIYAAMGVELTPAERERVTRRMTRNVQALLVFGAALEAADAGAHLRAAELFRQAAVLDPDFGEARRRAAESAAAAEAAGTTPRQLAAELAAEPPLLALEPADLAPIPLGRDPTSEALGSEGFTRPRTTVEIIIIRP